MCVCVCMCVKVEYFSCTDDVQVILLRGLAGDRPIQCVCVYRCIELVKVEELILRALHLEFCNFGKNKTKQKNPERQNIYIYIYSPT